MVGEDDALLRRIRGLFATEVADAVEVLNRDLVLLESAMATDAGMETVNALFRVAHSIKGAAHAAELPDAASLAHRIEDTLGSIRDGSRAVTATLVAGLLSAVDELAAIARAVEAAPASSSETRSRLAAVPVGDGGVGPTVRVGAAKLDSLVDQTSSLMGAAGRVRRLSHELARGPERTEGDVALEATRTAQELAHLADEMAATAVNLTFQPFSTACSGLDRIAHDLARAAGKEVRLEIEGGHVEVDRGVITALRDPLAHLVRNAVHHGIEPPARRRAQGKPELGVVTVVASVEHGELEVLVTDDGAGLDRAALAAASASRGMSPDDPSALAFAPGVTTAATVTEASGRGVGLDAVRTQLEALGGSAEIAESSAAGTWVRLRSPITLALMRILHVEAGGQTFGLPLTAVSRVVDLRSHDPEGEVGPGPAADVPPVPLARALQLASPARPQQGAHLALLVEIGSQSVALGVDAIHGEVEVVVRPTPQRLEGLETVLGTTNRINGDPTLILNASACARQALRQDPDDEPAPPPAPRIVVAEDSPATRALQVEILDGAGYDVLAAADGERAWQLLEQHGADLLVTDIDMPRLGGLDLCRRVRASERFADLPVVMVTSLGTPTDREAGLQAGASAYLIKAEFHRTTFLDMVARSL